MIAEEQHLEVDDLFPAAEALQMLRFAEVEGGDIRLTEAGLQFARGDTDERKKLFARHLITYVPLAAHIRRVLDERASHTAPKSRFFDELEDYMAEDAAEQTLRTIISWGRYAEVFAYDDSRQAFSLKGARPERRRGAVLLPSVAASQPPPSAWMSATLATSRLWRMPSSVCASPSATVCAVTTEV